MELASDLGVFDAGTATGFGGGVRVERVDEAVLSDEGLRLHLGVLGRAESSIAAMKSRALAELSRRSSTAVAQRLVRD